MCLSCSAKTKSHPGRAPFDINRQAAYAVSEIGCGRENLATFCGIMCMPLPSETTTWHAHVKAVNDAALSLRRRLAADNVNLTDINDFSQVIDVAVSFDGTWHHCGFKSSHGVGIVMVIDTVEVLDFEVLSKDCSICMKNSNSNLSDDWKKLHAESGLYEKTCGEPSTAMETLAAKVLWARSEEKGLRYTTDLSDGDNKTIVALNQLSPYGDIVIEKTDCVNHVHKRMGAGLRALQKINKEVKGGRDGLTKALIDSMSAYYKKAIMDHTTASKHPDEIQHAIKEMNKRIIGNLHHTIYHENPEEQHKFCDDTWGPHQKDISNNTSTYDHLKQKSKRLLQSYLVHLLPLYKRLSSDDLLLRCVAGLTQNQNEAFNATVWRRCPNEKVFGASAARRAVCLAAIS